MNPKLQLLKHTIALWTMLAVTILMLVVFIILWPVDILPQLLWFVIIVLLANAILYGVGMWVWQLRIYLKSRQPEDKSEQEKWGI